MVLTVLVPTAIYVCAVTWIGIYVSSVAVHRLLHALARQVRVVEGRCGERRRRVVFFVIFEIWFKVPLPKGPLEALLGTGR